MSRGAPKLPGAALQSTAEKIPKVSSTLFPRIGLAHALIIEGKSKRRLVPSNIQGTAQKYR